MARAECLFDGFLHVGDQLWGELASWTHQQEQHHRLVGVLRTSLANAERVDDILGKLRVDDIVDLTGAESDTRGVQHAVRSTQEEYLLGLGMDHDEVAVGPHVFQKLAQSFLYQNWYQGAYCRSAQSTNQSTSAAHRLRGTSPAWSGNYA